MKIPFTQFSLKVIVRPFSAPNLNYIKPIGKINFSEKSVYDTGQFFLHKKFGYKGVILKNWTTKFSNKDKSLKSSLDHPNELSVYQVLADKKDLVECESYLKSGLTFLHNYDKYSGVLHHISGVDYAFHEDILPLDISSSETIDNPYLHEFFHLNDEGFTPKDNLHAWLEEKKGFLASQNISQDVTNGVKVTAVTFFMGRKSIKNAEEEEKLSRLWRYLIRIEYFGEERIQLRERFWKIFSVDGSIESLSGAGVVGKEPFFTQNNRIFQYHSHVQVNVPWAHVWGSYRFDRDDGTAFDVRIPAFPICDKTEEKMKDEDFDPTLIDPPNSENDENKK